MFLANQKQNGSWVLWTYIYSLYTREPEINTFILCVIKKKLHKPVYDTLDNLTQ